ncbi:putative disease resistance protein RGA1 [Lotus japonicus]|uniref:putative disease resistance protein RGA1 n=1 Tax=Lotus japonicus TaxID=34305 RepID=UPI002582DD31|nr:putative disease resistance protein RGA1 [Lotus japonicus]
MAEALLGAVFENLLSMVRNEFATISGIKGKAEKLSRTLELIKAIVEDAEEKQITNRSIKVWLQQLKDAVYILDDILDECSIESLRLGGLSSLKPKNIKFRYEIGKRLKDITRRFDDIAEGKTKFLLQEGVRERPAEVAEWRQTSSIIPQPQIYGRQDDKEKIVEFLLSQERDSDFLSVYPIVGLGGMGKTTLSQMVYNDNRVSDNFNPKTWICVSENFSVKRICCSIVESVTGEKYDALGLDVIERKVQTLLQSKRYLLVLDDVWNRNQEMEFGLSQEKWNQLKSVLLCGSKGSSVLVSTRDMDVAAIMGTCQAHCLRGLSVDDCWLLFKQYAFGANNEERVELVAIGKEIIKKCGGSPLAARALGGLLHSRNEEKEWVEVKESRLWNLQDERCIFPALRLSYFHLTPTLRQCFAFCAIFPKYTFIDKEDLIFLWMANGFISSRENMEAEHVGNMIWNELYQKSFFHIIHISDEGDTTFIMHDLVHDLAQSIMGNECVILKNANMTDLSSSTHHVVLDPSSEKLSFNKGTFEKVESLRTVYQLQFSIREISACFPTHHALRVLRTRSFNLSRLGSLIHLRYLELCDFEIKSLPDSICNLRKLEILKLKELRKLICLPEHLACLQNLRHLVIENCDSLSCMFPNIGKLSCLRTLSGYIVSSKIGHSLAELHDLKLGGEMHITGLENSGSSYEAQEANLKGKEDLRELWLTWNNKFHATNPDQVLEALQPHSNLKKLRIYGYAGLKSPSWIGMLNNLVDFQLHHCNECLQLSSLGRLPSLRKLKLRYVNNIQCMDDDESYNGVEVKAFPSLEQLSLYDLPKLEMLLKVERGEMFARLCSLRVRRCPKLELPSCIPSLTSLYLCEYTNELLRFFSRFTGITSLCLKNGQEDLPSLPVESLACLKNLDIYAFPRLKELPGELFNNLIALEHLEIRRCDELESLPEQGWEGLRSLRTLHFSNCEGLRSLPDGVRHLTSLETLTIWGCPTLKERCKEETGADWYKIAHVPQLEIK